MLELLRFINFLLDIYIFVLFAAAILSWLIVFNVVNTRNPAALSRTLRKGWVNIWPSALKTASSISHHLLAEIDFGYSDIELPWKMR